MWAPDLRRRLRQSFAVAPADNPRMLRERIATVSEFVQWVEAQPRMVALWYRGETADTTTPLLPRIWRQQHDENTLLQLFRMQAPIYAGGAYPDREAIDQWLFLAQHMRLPTRLLDWTESALAGLYFSVLSDRPVVWVLDPMRLNELADPKGRRQFPLSWEDPDNPMAVDNIRAAWQYDRHDPPGVTLPVAIHPTNIHPRMSVQRSCFTPWQRPSFTAGTGERLPRSVAPCGAH